MSKVTHVDLEVSSTCQASCSACARNSSGITVINPENQTLASIQRAYKTISKEIKTITFCGNVGDSMGNKDIALICRWFIMRNPNILITVHTNGGLGSPQTYKELAILGVRVIFGIDGLEDTNHYHRIGVKWSNIVRNLEAFQSGFENKIKVRWTPQFNDDDDGGEFRMAIIQMIIWRHNQHQIVDMARFAQKYNCSVWYRKAVLDKDPRLGNGMAVFNGKGEWVCNLHEPSSLFEPLNGAHFICPTINHPDNNLDTQVINFMNYACQTQGINIHQWSRLQQKPIPVDTENKPEGIDTWHEHVPIKWHEPRRVDTYNVNLTDEQLETLSIPVACKSYNFDKPADIYNSDAEREVFVGADGYITPCCMIGSALTLHLQNALDDNDHSYINDLKKDVVNRIINIGIEKFDSSKYTMQQIIESGVLDELVWERITDHNAKEGRVPFCSAHCGTLGAYGRPSIDDRDNNIG